MQKQTSLHSRKTGLAPGTIIHVGQQKTEHIRIILLDYDRNNFQERVVQQIEECFPFKDTATVTWINIDGLHDTETIEDLGRHFDMHPLILEDVVNTTQRPKCDDYDNNLFMVLKMLRGDKSGNIQSEQVSIVLGQNFVISFQESVGDVFEQVRDRIRKDKGRIRKMSADYLAYSLLDAVVDNYFLILERMGERIEALEEKIIGDPSDKSVREIHKLKSELIFLRRAVWPLRELVNRMQKSESELIGEPVGPYFRDVYDHTIQIIDTIESYRDMVSGMLDIYLSSISNKMNAVMKVLTIIATIFIPLTFIAGVYGMNFKYMPELEYKWAYPAVWVIMVIVTLGMLVYFRRKKWL